MKPIGFIRSEFKEKFGLPKQSGLAPSLEAQLVFEGEYAHESFWKGIDQCSHLWIIFHFHESESFTGATVRPPVLGGEKRMGVFARSPHRPNPVGLSLVKCESIEFNGTMALIKVRGHDFLDGTPIFDVKPYVATYDVPNTPSSHWSESKPQSPLKISWETSLENELMSKKIEEILRLDPRPRVSKAKSFGLAIEGLNVIFEAEDEGLVVKSVLPVGHHIK